MTGDNLEIARRERNLREFEYQARHDEAARDFQRGTLSEEREALAVRALAQAGRRDEAATRAARFKVRYPRSLLLPVVEAVTNP